MQKRILTTVLCLAMLLTWSASAHVRVACAGDSDELIKLLRILLNSRQIEGLEEFLDEAIKAALAEDPQGACDFCGLVEEVMPGVARGKGGEKNGSSLLATARDVAARLEKDHADSPLSPRAKAYTLSAGARLRLARGTHEGTGPWEECAQLCMQASEKADGEARNEYIASASRYLAEGYPHAGERAPEILKQAEEIVQKGLEAKPGDTHLTAALSNIYVRQAELSLANKKKPDATKSIEQALALVKPEGEVPIGRAGDARARAYNEILIFAAENKIRVKGETINRQRKVSAWTVCYPRGLGWEYSMGGGGGQTVFTLSRAYPEGRAFIIMTSYSWDRLYTTPDGEAGGDNTGGIMKQSQQQALADLADVKKLKKKVGGKLNRGVKKTVGYEASGTDSENDPVSVRGYYFKGDNHRMTYGVEIWLYGTVDPKDPQLKLILDHIVELPAND